MRTLLWLALLARVAGAQGASGCRFNPLYLLRRRPAQIVILTGRALDGPRWRIENASIGVARGKITSLAGFTTVQSVGTLGPAPRHDPRPRLRPARAHVAVPDPGGHHGVGRFKLRAMVRAARRGGGSHQVFASKSERVGAGPTITEAQLRGNFCGEAAAQDSGRWCTRTGRRRARSSARKSVSSCRTTSRTRARYVGAAASPTRAWMSWSAICPATSRSARSRCTRRWPLTDLSCGAWCCVMRGGVVYKWTGR